MIASAASDGSPSRAVMHRDDIKLGGCDAEEGARNMRALVLKRVQEVKWAEARARAEAATDSEGSLHTGNLLKLSTNGDPFNLEHWRERRMWITANGDLCYESEMENKNLIFLGKQALIHSIIHEYDMSAHNHCIQVELMRGSDCHNNVRETVLLACQDELQFKLWLRALADVKHLDEAWSIKQAQEDEQVEKELYEVPRGMVNDPFYKTLADSLNLVFVAPGCKHQCSRELSSKDVSRAGSKVRPSSASSAVDRHRQKPVDFPASPVEALRWPKPRPHSAGSIAGRHRETQMFDQRKMFDQRNPEYSSKYRQGRQRTIAMGRNCRLSGVITIPNAPSTNLQSRKTVLVRDRWR